MAVVKGAFHCDQASGNVGALCASRWRDLTVMRDAWTGTVPNTTAQQTVQNVMISVAQAWGGTLSGDDRAAWELLAESVWVNDRFGNKRHPSGYNLFLARNWRRKRWGLSILNKPYGEVFRNLAKTFQLVYEGSGPDVFARLYDYETSDMPYGVEFWKAGAYNTEARNPIAGEWRIVKLQKHPPNYYRDYSIIASKWYWYKAGMFHESGIVTPFLIGQVFTG